MLKKKSNKKVTQIFLLGTAGSSAYYLSSLRLRHTKTFSFSRFFLEKSSNKEGEGNKFSQNSNFYS